MQSEPSCRVIDMRRNVVRIREIGCRCAMAEIDVAVAPLVEQERGMRLDAAMHGLHFTNHHPMVAHVEVPLFRALETGKRAFQAERIARGYEAEGGWNRLPPAPGKVC